MKPPPTDIEFYKRENSRLYVDIERRNADNAKLREDNTLLKSMQREYDLLKINEPLLNKRIIDLEFVLGKLRKGHSAASGCNKPINGICNCGGDEQNARIDLALGVN